MQQKLAHIIQRYNTSTLWASVNPILLLGELGIESDTGKAKLGDGSTSWNSLDYFITMAGAPSYSAGAGMQLDKNVLSHGLQYEVVG